MVKSPDEVFKLCDKLVDDVTNLYEALTDQEVDESKMIISQLESKLDKLKKEL